MQGNASAPKVPRRFVIIIKINEEKKERKFLLGTIVRIQSCKESIYGRKSEDRIATQSMS